MFECFGSKLIEHLGRIRRCGLVKGGVSLAVGFDVPIAHTIPT